MTSRDTSADTTLDNANMDYLYRAMVEDGIVEPTPQSRLEIDALKAENERLRKDAERLDWMEAHPRLGEIHVGGEVKDCYLYALSGALGAPLRAIIDAAMSALPENEGE